MKKRLLAYDNILPKGLVLTMIMIISINVAVLAQNRPITGKVLSGANDSTLAGATVKVKGASLSTSTGADGTFTINAAPNATLIISNIGFATQQIALNNRSSITVSMLADPQSLTQVVVIGYGTVKRKDLTGSISSVSADVIAKVPVTSLDQALQGRAAGVQVINNDAAPGGSVTVLVRGTGSLASGGNTPLYVIDGYPVSGGLNNINPSDIASIDVLKDASATAIYGIRAANGVVIVTTKKGKKGGAEVSVDAYNAFQSRPKEYKVLNAFDWGTLANQVADADPAHNFIEMPIWRTPTALHNLDWQNALYGSGLSQNYSIGIRGGSDKVQSAFSAGYYNQKGIVEGSYFKRLTFGANVDFTPVKWLRSSTSAKYTYQNANNPFGTGSLVQLSELPPTMDNGNPATPLIKDGKGNYGFYNPNETYVAKYNNPVFNLETNQYQNITNFLLVNSSLEVTLFDGLKVKTLAGVNTTNYSGSFYQPEDDRIHALFPSAIQGNALYSQHLNGTFEWLWENTLSYDKTFGKHTIHFVGGLSAQKNTRTFMGGQGIPPNTVIRDLSQVTNLQLDAFSPSGLGNPGNGQTIYSLASEFARLSYEFSDKYIITGTLRRDGSSKFDVGHQYGTFPSGAALWKIKNESFLENVGWVSNLSLRGSYGEVGNQGAIPLFQYLALFGTGGPGSLNGGGADNLGYPFDKLYQGGIAQIQPSNPTLKWETDYQTDIGADAAFLHGALTITADWYNRRSKDFLLNLASPAQSGYLLTTRNVGSMDNKGIELAVNYRGNQGRDFQYGIGVTFASNKNTLTSLTSGSNFITNFGGTTANPNTAFAPTGLGWSTFTETNIGQPVGEFYGYKTLGIFQTQAQINALNLAAQNAKVPAPYYQKAVNLPGDRYFADVNKDGHVDATDQVSLGSPQPKFFGGVNLDASYKAWDINLYFYGVYGNKIDNYVESALESFQNRGFTGVENVSQTYYKDRWTPTNPSNRYARATYNDDAVGSNVPSSTWVEDGSFLKLKNLTIGYTLPSSLSKMATLTKVRFYVSSQNLFTITKYSGLDPEIGLQNGNATQAGVDNGVYPSSRYFTVGLNVTF